MPDNLPAYKNLTLTNSSDNYAPAFFGPKGRTLPEWPNDPRFIENKS